MSMFTMQNIRWLVLTKKVGVGVGVELNPNFRLCIG